MAGIPFGLLLAPQVASVLGDLLAQRCNRVWYKASRRRFVIALSIVTCLQAFVVLTIIQFAAPTATSAVYHKDANVCLLNDPAVVAKYGCYAQGPITMYRLIGDCPTVLLNGILAVAFYLTEGTLYAHPMGVVLLVLASLSSAFLVAPLGAMVGVEQHGSHPPPLVTTVVTVFGIVGALLCLVDKLPVKHAGEQEPLVDGEINNGDDETVADQQAGYKWDSVVPENVAESSRRTAVQAFVRVLIPFGIVALCYAMWFVVIAKFNQNCHINPWGYTTLDQVLLPVYLLPALWLVDICRPLKTVLETTTDQRESFAAAFVGALKDLVDNKCAGLATMFVYRLLINGRAVAYAYIAIRYNVHEAYLELTLIRVVLSSAAVVAVVALFPGFAHTTSAERRRAMYWVNVACKVAGIFIIIISLLVLKSVIHL